MYSNATSRFEDVQRPLLEDEEQDGIELSRVDAEPSLAHDLCDDAAQQAINELDQSVNATDPSNASQYGRKLRHLSKACKRYRRLPSTCVLQETNGLVVECQAFAKGGFAEVYRGSLEGFGQIAVKRLRPDVLLQQPELLFLEAVIWKHANHRNIAPFIAALVHAPSPCLISPWMNHGNIISYLKEHPETDIQPLILNIIDGCRFLHGISVVHGDLKGANILVNENQEACLSDFGMSNVYRNAVDQQIGTASWTTTVLGGGSIRWLAPELLFSPVEKPSFASDAYAFGVVLWEILTCRIPYEHLSTDQSVMLHVSQGFRPCFRCITDSPADVGNLIEIMRNCWATLPHARPKISTDLRQRLFQRLPPKIREISWLSRCMLILSSLIGIAASHALGLAARAEAFSLPTIPLATVVIFTTIFVILAVRYILLRTYGIIPWLIVGPSRTGTLYNTFFTAVHLTCIPGAIFSCSLGFFLRFAEIPEAWGPEEAFRRFSFVFLWVTVGLSLISGVYHDVKNVFILLWLQCWEQKARDRDDDDEIQASVVTHTQLLVSNVGPLVSEDDIRYMFEASGEIESVSMHRPGHHCVVQYRDDRDAERILASGDFLTTLRISRRTIRMLKLDEEEYVPPTSIQVLVELDMASSHYHIIPGTSQLDFLLAGWSTLSIRSFYVEV
ncbi:kinase-like protein [Gymnopus androsaceus JB14]|uniref:Kinase-like protein n=1 Tax=Gymnopus androsaceus JB14 TaxID=1447944 RepID=A0A6A4HK38_9AGAR|nr:kinase-like protein [Gymnopus androsaceus JB14]